MTHHFFDIGASSYLRSLVFLIHSAKKSVKVFEFLWMCNSPAFRFSSYFNGTFVLEYLPETNVDWSPETTLWMYCRQTFLKIFLPTTVKVGGTATIAVSALLSGCQSSDLILPSAVNGQRFSVAPKDSIVTQWQNYFTENSLDHYSGHHKIARQYYDQEIKSLDALLKKQKRTFTWITACFSMLSIVGVGLVIKLIKRDRNRKREKEDFITEQMKNYDRRILQMLIVKAEYEEIKNQAEK